jgi:CRP-like cAMP-binding protein
MRAVLDYCTGGTERQVAAGTLVVAEGGTTGHLYVLMQGKLEVLKGEMVVATVTEPGAVLGEMSVLLGLPHTATVRACSDAVVYEFEDAASFLKQEPEVALLIARLLAQRSGSMSRTLIWPISNGNMPATAHTSPWSAKCSRA